MALLEIKAKKSRTKSNHDAERNHMHMVVRLGDLFGFVNDLKKVIIGSGIKFLIKRKILVIDRYIQLTLVLVLL